RPRDVRAHELDPGACVLELADRTGYRRTRRAAARQHDTTCTSLHQPAADLQPQSPAPTSDEVRRVRIERRPACAVELSDDDLADVFRLRHVAERAGGLHGIEHPR